MAITDHPNIQNLETLTGAIFNAVESKQAEFAIANAGELFQGSSLFDTEVIKPDGVTSISVDVDRTPSDKGTSWKNFDGTNFPKNLKLPVNGKIHIHDEPDGWAFTIIIEFWYDGIGPDQAGNDGSHWVKSYYKKIGGPIGTVTDWYIQYEGSV